MFELLISTKAKRKIKLLKKLHQEAIISAFSEISENPYLGKPLTKELTGRLSFRVGVHRIIYTIDQTDNVIRILDAGHRATVYK